MIRIQPSQIPPDIFIKTGDLLRSSFLIEYHEREYIVTVSEKGLSVYEVDRAEPVGRIKFGSPSSGAIWATDDCIAEYTQDESGAYAVMPIRHGFKLPEEFRQEHPLLHLLALAT